MKIIRGYRNAYGPSRSYTGRFGAASVGSGQGSVDDSSTADGSDPSPTQLEIDADPTDPSDDDLSGGMGSNGGSNGGVNIPPEYLGDPIFLKAETVINSQASITTPNQESLRNPYPSVIEICEIRFMLTTSLPGAPTRNPYQSPAANIGVILSLNGDQLTQSANGVPVNLLCAGQQANAESIAYGSFEWANTAPTSFVGSYRHVLKTPLQILPNELLEIQLASLSLLTSPVDVTVSYIGRVRPDLQVPTKRIVPFFAAYSAMQLSQPAISANTVNSTSSSETDLQNPFDDAIRIHRFIGRINAMFFGSGTSPGPFTEFTDSAASAQVGNTATLTPGSDKVLVSMNKSTGTPTIAPNTPFRLAFDAMTRSWETDDVLQPQGYYIATVSVLQPDTGVDLGVVPIYAGIAFHAERLVEIDSSAEGS